MPEVVPLRRLWRCRIQPPAIAVAIALAGACRHAPQTPGTTYAGTWMMALQHRTFMVLTIEPEGPTFRATLRAPSSFDLPAGGSRLGYSHIQLPIQERRSRSVKVENDQLQIVIDDPRSPNEPDEFTFRLTDPNHSALQYVGIPVAPFSLTRYSGPPPAIATDWEANRSYTLEDEVVTPNAHMSALYDADQHDRQEIDASAATWAVVEQADRERRERVSALLAAGALHTGDDYRKAAFVFQHGDGPDDYLLAHTLALVAVAKGDQGAAWIAAATLDRYLQASGRPQIYGTQFVQTGRAVTQSPYNTGLIPDALRGELGVPNQATQAEQLKTMQMNSSDK